MFLSGKQPPPFARLSIRRVMVQGVSCPHGRPQHNEHPSIVDFGPNFIDLSRTPEEENDKEVAKTHVDLIGTIFRTVVSIHRRIFVLSTI